jgi:WD40 repeat protein
MTRKRAYSRILAASSSISRMVQRRTARQVADRAQAGDPSAVQRLIAMLTSNSDEELQNIIKDALSSLTQPNTIDALCQSILAMDCPVLEQIARHQEYMPSDEGSRALFLICIDRWHHYELPEGESVSVPLRKAFIQAPDAVKSRVREKIRRNGLGHLLYDDLVLCPTASVRPDLSGQDWDIIVQELQDEGRNDDLWSLLFCVPPYNSLMILRNLQKKGWNPSSLSDRKFWNEILLHQSNLSIFRPPVNVSWRENRNGEMTSLSVMPGGNLLASGNMKGVISLWTLPEGNFLTTRVMHVDRVDHLIFSRDASLLASADRTGIVHVSCSTDLTIQGTFTCPRGVQYLRFTPDGRQLMSVDSSGNVKVWDIQKHTILNRFDTYQRNIIWLDIVMGSDGSLYLITGSETIICLFVLAGGELRSTLHHRTKRSTSFSTSGDGSMLFIGFSDSTIRCYQIPDLSPINILRGHEVEVTALTEAAGGLLLVSGSANGMICLWDLPAGTLRTTIRTHGGAIYHLKSCLHNTKLVSGGNDGTVRLWHLPDGSPSGTFQDPEHHIRSFIITSDESLLITQGDNQETRLWSMVDARPYGALRSAPEYISALVIHPEEEILVSAGSDRILYVRTLGDGSLVKTIAIDTGKITSLAFLPDGKYLASGGDDRMIHLWDIQTGNRMRSLQGSKGTISAIAINPDGTLIAGGGWDEVIRLWNPSDGSLRGEMKGHSSAITALCFSPDGKILASTGNDSSILLWNFRTHEHIFRLHGHKGVISCLAFTPNGQFLLSGGWDKKVCVWNPDTGALCRVLDGNPEKITQLTISSDGSTVIAGCQDGTIRFWSLYDGMLSLTLWGHTGAITALAGAKNRIISGGEDGFIKSWTLPWVKPLALATPQDLFSVQYLMADKVNSREADLSGAFLEALIRGKVRYDIETEAIAYPCGEFDIEIALEGPS